tara:strand:+ start:902 stop:3238 length:2337 start_codon:yes stop_codon:yes gene_type:complete
MATAADIKKLREQLERLKEEYEAISNLDAPVLFDPKEEQTAKQLEGHITMMQSSIKNMKPDLEGISDIFKNTVNELTKGNKELVRQRQSLNKSSNLADQLLQIKKGETAANSKSIGKLTEKLKLEKQNLIYLARQRKARGESREDLESQISQLQGVIKSAENLDAVYEKTNKQLGFGPQLLAGMDKGLQKLGLPPLGIDSALEETHKLAQSAEDAGEEFNASAAFTKQLGSNLKKAASNANFLQMAAGFILKSFLDVDKSVGDFAKNMNMSYSEASKVKQEMTNIANTSGDTLLNSQRLMESQVAVGNALGSNAMLNKADLETMTKMTAAAGLTHDELMGIQKMSLVNGKTLEDNTKEILGSAKAYASSNKLVLNEKQILKDVNKASASLKLSLGANPALLAEAAAKARQFGLNLEQADKIASSLLDFESSIENELQAELLTGKNLNLEKARELALNNDIAGAAEEIAKQVGSSADFANMNRIQQEALAKAAGLTRDELAQSLMDREALNKLSEVEGANAQEKFNNLVKEKGMAAAKAQLGDEELAKMMEQQSVQDKFNDTMAQLKEMLSESLLPAFEKMGNFLKENMGLVKGIVKLMIALKTAQLVYNGVQAVSLALSKKQASAEKKDAVASTYSGAMKSLGGIPIVGIGLALAAAIGVIAAMNGAFSKANDMVNQPGYGNRTLLGPEGAIQLNNKDTVIAGTNLFGDDVKSEPGKSTETSGKGEIKLQSPSAPPLNLAPLESKMDLLIAAIEKRQVIEMDGSKVGEAISNESRQVQ